MVTKSRYEAGKSAHPAFSVTGVTSRPSLADAALPLDELLKLVILQLFQAYGEAFHDPDPGRMLGLAPALRRRPSKDRCLVGPQPIRALRSGKSINPTDLAGGRSFDRPSDETPKTARPDPRSHTRPCHSSSAAPAAASPIAWASCRAACPVTTGLQPVGRRERLSVVSWPRQPHGARVADPARPRGRPSTVSCAALLPQLRPFGTFHAVKPAHWPQLRRFGDRRGGGGGVGGGWGQEAGWLRYSS